MTKKTYTQAEARAKAVEIDGTLRHTDFDRGQVIYACDVEGAWSVMPAAFALRYGDWYIVLSEHHKPAVFHVDETRVETYQRQKIKYPDASKFKTKRKGATK